MGTTSDPFRIKCSRSERLFSLSNHSFQFLRLRRRAIHWLEVSWPVGTKLLTNHSWVIEQYSARLTGNRSCSYSHSFRKHDLVSNKRQFSLKPANSRIRQVVNLGPNGEMSCVLQSHYFKCSLEWITTVIQFFQRPVKVNPEILGEGTL